MTIKTYPKVTRLSDKEPTLTQLQSLVGGYLEVITLPKSQLVMNENGRIIGLPLNWEATLYFRDNFRKLGEDQFYRDGWDIVRGDVVILTGDARMK